MDSSKIKIAEIGNGWKGQTIYVDLFAERAIIVSREVTHWGYHDESEWDEHTYTVSLEQAFKKIRSEKATIPEEFRKIIMQTERVNGDTWRKLASAAGVSRRAQKKKKKKSSAVQIITDTPPTASAKPTGAETNHTIDILRQKILKSRKQNPSNEYELAAFFWGDAQKCFAGNWDSVQFKINLTTKALFAECSNYPNQFSSASLRTEIHRLTPSEFHDYATRLNMSQELQCMRTAKDWEKLFND